MADVIRGAGVSEEDYRRQIPERVMPVDFKLQSDYIFRALLRVAFRSPRSFAVDIFVKMVGLKIEQGKIWDQIVELDLVDCNISDDWVRPVSYEGFVICPNFGPNKVADLPEGVHEIGYFLGKTSLTDSDLTLLTTQPVLLS